MHWTHYSRPLLTSVLGKTDAQLHPLPLIQQWRAVMLAERTLTWPRINKDSTINGFIAPRMGCRVSGPTPGEGGQRGPMQHHTTAILASSC